MSLSEQNVSLLTRFMSGVSRERVGYFTVEHETMGALLDAARAEQKEDGSSVAESGSTPFGRTDGQRSAGKGAICPFRVTTAAGDAHFLALETAQEAARYEASISPYPVSIELFQDRPRGGVWVQIETFPGEDCL